MNFAAALLGLLLACFSTVIFAERPDGTWKFEKSVDFDGMLRDIKPPQHLTVQILNKKVAFSSGCVMTLREKKVKYSETFQGPLKSGVGRQDMETFLHKQFSIQSLSSANSYAVIDKYASCEPIGDLFFVAEDRLVFLKGETIFHSFVRSNGKVGDISGPKINLYGYKISELPFILSNYSVLCPRTLKTDLASREQSCLPLYFKYSVSPKIDDPINRVIGSFNYRRGRNRNVADYDNPVKNGRHPTFALLPPLKDVLIVRVDDEEQGDSYNRDGISGAYLTIKDGVVVDYLDEGCDIGEQYYCIDESGKRLYQILDSGKFKKLN